MIRRVVRGTGKTLIALGILILLFVGYQLWGTGLAHSRAQRDLKSGFARQLAATPPPSPGPGPAVTEPPAAAVEGEAVALVQIPKIDVDEAIVEGVGVEDLKKGPGHYPDTRMPGETGNAAIAGHRTTYGAPFYRLNELEVGDPITVTTRTGRYRYEVMESKVVTPDDSYVLDDTPDNRLTLTTCHPRYSAAQRLIIVARLATPALALPTTPGATSPRPPRLVSDARAGLSGDRAARGPTVTWGALAAAVALATWWLSRLWSHRWAAYLLGGPVFLGVLFVFFENVARLLPANV